MISEQLKATIAQLSKNIGDVMEKADYNITFWFNVNLSVEVTIAVVGLITALAAAIQNERNSRYVKPIAVTAAIMLTTANAVVTQFHIRENIRTSAKVFVDLKDMKYNLDTAAIALKDDQEAAELIKTFSSDLAKSYREFLATYTYFGSSQQVSLPTPPGPPPRPPGPASGAAPH